MSETFYRLLLYFWMTFDKVEKNFFRNWPKFLQKFHSSLVEVILYLPPDSAKYQYQIWPKLGASWFLDHTLAKFVPWDFVKLGRIELAPTLAKHRPKSAWVPPIGPLLPTLAKLCQKPFKSLRKVFLKFGVGYLDFGATSTQKFGKSLGPIVVQISIFAKFGPNFYHF